MNDHNADYKAMYYLLAGRLASAVETLEATIKVLESTTKSTVDAFAEIKEGLKNAQQAAEDMFIN